MRKYGVQRTIFRAVYGFLLLRLTVFRPGCFTHGLASGRLNLTPGLAYRQLLSWHSYRAAARLFFGNIAFFLPLGAALARWGKGLAAALRAGFLLSFAIECAQFLLGSGLAETDDLLLNTLGAGLGWGMYALYARRKAARCGRVGKENPDGAVGDGDRTRI